MPQHVAPIVDLSRLPEVLTLNEVASVYRISPLTVRRGLSTNTFRPLPFKKYPYRWRRSDVERDLAMTQPRLPTRRHGFAAVKARKDQAAEAEQDAAAPPDQTEAAAELSPITED